MLQSTCHLFENTESIGDHRKRHNIWPLPYTSTVNTSLRPAFACFRVFPRSLHSFLHSNPYRKAQRLLTSHRKEKSYSSVSSQPKIKIKTSTTPIHVQEIYDLHEYTLALDTPPEQAIPPPYPTSITQTVSTLFSSYIFPRHNTNKARIRNSPTKSSPPPSQPPPTSPSASSQFPASSTWPNQQFLHISPVRSRLRKWHA